MRALLKSYRFKLCKYTKESMALFCLFVKITLLQDNDHSFHSYLQVSSLSDKMYIENIFLSLLVPFYIFFHPLRYVKNNKVNNKVVILHNVEGNCNLFFFPHSRSFQNQEGSEINYLVTLRRSEEYKPCNGVTTISGTVCISLRRALFYECCSWGSYALREY